MKSSIIIYQKAYFIEFSFFIEFNTFFIDRRDYRNFQLRINQDRENREYQHQKHQNRRKQSQRRTGKKCFVCQKEECWSTKHSRKKREEAKRKLKNRFSDQTNKRIDQRINQYIAEYKELKDENDQNTNNEMIKKMKVLMIDFSSSSFFEKNSNNTETFIITFESMKNLELMIIDLTNRSLTHYLIDVYTDMNDQTLTHLQIDLKNEFLIITIVHTGMKNTNPDSFAYVMTSNRYIFEKFYEIMIDSDASTKSTAEYEQYLAFNKINSTINLNLFRAEKVNV